MAESHLPPDTSAPEQPAPEYTNTQESVGQQYFLPNQPEPEYLLLEWLADSRIVRKRSKEYYSSLAVIVLLLSLILFFANQILLIFVLISFLFVTYVLSSVKPDTVHNQLTSYGVRYRDRMYPWASLGRFWISEHQGQAQIHIEAPAFLANQIVLLPSNESSPIYVTIEDMLDVLSRYLLYQEPNPTQIDRWVQWIEEKFPLEGKPEPASGAPQNSAPTDPPTTSPPQSASPPPPPAAPAAEVPHPKPQPVAGASQPPSER